MEQFEKTLEIDPVVDLDYDYKPSDVIFKGCTEKTVYPIGASTFTDNNIGFQNISPASLTTVVDREFRVKYSLYVAVSFPGNGYGNYPMLQAVAGQGVNRVFPLVAGGTVPVNAYVVGALANDPAGSSITGNAGAGTVVAGNSIVNLCLRAFPLQSALSSLEVFLNGQSISIPQNDLICLQPYMMTDNEIEHNVLFPCQRENSSLYNKITAGDNRNPFNNFEQNTSTSSRGSQVATLIYEAQTAASAVTVFGTVYRVYRYDLCESLVIPPLVYGNCYDADGLANIMNISMNLTINNLNRALSLVPGLVAGSTVQAHLANFTWNGVQQVAIQPQFIPTYFTQDPVLSARQGSNLFYNYDQFLVDANSNAISNAINNVIVDAPWNGNALRSNIIPDDIFVYIKPRKNTLDATNPDTFLRIKKLQISIGNRANVFSSFTEEDLWRMSCKNGMRISWHEWCNTIGSVIKINVASDIGLVSDEASGQTKFTQIKIDGIYSTSNLTYCQANGAVLYDVMTVLVSQGKAVVSPNTVSLKVGGISTSDVLLLTSAKENTVASGLRKKLATSRGGNMLSTTGRMLEKGLNMAKSVVRPEVLQQAQDYMQSGLDSLGLNDGGAIAGAGVAGGRLRKEKHRRVI